MIIPTSRNDYTAGFADGYRQGKKDAERKKGWWIYKAEEFYNAVNEKGGGVDESTPFFVDDIACSECLLMFSVIDNEAERFNFCPNCGADMRGGEDETD